MDISKTIAKMKQNPDFAENVGMLLVHNGVVRAWSRQSRDQVEYLEVTPDQDKVEEIRQEFLQRASSSCRPRTAVCNSQHYCCQES